MKNSKIIIIGNSPGVCICAIYLKTANIPITLIRKDMNLNFKATYIAGLPNITSDQFIENSFLQAKNMNIEYLNSDNIEIKILEDKKFILKSDKFELITDILVLDKNIFNFKKNDNIFIIEEYLKNVEGIEIASAGCKIAFDIKEILNN